MVIDGCIGGKCPDRYMIPIKKDSIWFVRHYPHTAKQGLTLNIFTYLTSHQSWQHPETQHTLSEVPEHIYWLQMRNEIPDGVYWVPQMRGRTKCFPYKRYNICFGLVARAPESPHGWRTARHRSIVVRLSEALALKHDSVWHTPFLPVTFENRISTGWVDW